MIEKLITILESFNGITGLSENRGNLKINDSESFELVLKNKLDGAGFVNLSSDFEILKSIEKVIPNGVIPKNAFIPNGNPLFDGLPYKLSNEQKVKVKANATTLLNLLKNELQRYDTDGLLPSYPFYIYQPYSSQGSLDFIIVIGGYIIHIECKTKEGNGGKFNDTIPTLNTIVLFYNTENGIDTPFTFFFMHDIITTEAYESYLTAREEHQIFKELQEQTYNKYPPEIKNYFGKPSSRPILSLGALNKDWFSDIMGISSKRREENVINFLRSIKYDHDKHL